MPTIARRGPYRVYFFSRDMHEPPHVHVDRDDKTAKFWLEPVTLARNIGFQPREIREVYRIVSKEAAFFLEAWRGYFRPETRRAGNGRAL